MKRFKKITSMVITVVIAASAIMTVGAEKVDENSPVLLCAHAFTETVTEEELWVSRRTHPLYSSKYKLVATCSVHTYYTYRHQRCLNEDCKEIISTTTKLTHNHSICQ